MKEEQVKQRREVQVATPDGEAFGAEAVRLPFGLQGERGGVKGSSGGVADQEGCA